MSAEPFSIAFEPTAHAYHLNGKPVPSVTKVLQMIQTLEGIPWEVLENARIFGSNVHTAVHLDNLRTQEARGVVGRLATMSPSDKAAFLRAEAAKVGVTPCPLADSWSPPN